MNPIIYQIAVPVPLFKLFDYLSPQNHEAKDHCALQKGQRVRIPFRNKTIIGIVVNICSNSALPTKKLKHITQLIDDRPLINKQMLQLLSWAASYYHHPIGEVLPHALPPALRKGKCEADYLNKIAYATATGLQIDCTDLARAPRQQDIMLLLQQQPEGIALKQLTQQSGTSNAALKRLLEKGWLEISTTTAATVIKPIPDLAISLNEEQNAAYEKIAQSLHKTSTKFEVFLLDGVTGSGKTEVYCEAIRQCLNNGLQVLFLIPEIGLIPQTTQRLRQYFPTHVVEYHSAQNSTERAQSWLAAKNGQAKIIIGTRSAIFLSLANPGLIIVDEEHDASYKQQEGLRYHARDIAIKRAHLEDIPIVLGSATPALSSLLNATSARYTHLHLHQRYGNARQPHLHLLDITKLPMQDGISSELRKRIKLHLSHNNQVLLFINRRGFSPVLLCTECKHINGCQRCDARMTYHKQRHEMRCHHCGATRPKPTHCAECGHPELVPVGVGTERIEQALEAQFPDAEMIRVDRDSIRRKGEMQSLFDRIKNGHKQILIGTQMLSKGHDFPNITLVGILNADYGLYSPDFYANERMAQLITQVSGRAGRKDKKGEVIIQTAHPQHVKLLSLINGGYHQFATDELAERKLADLPPYSHIALLSAESVNANNALSFLSQLKSQLLSNVDAATHQQVLGPAIPAMAKRAGKFRAQLLLQCAERKTLHTLAHQLLALITSRAESRHVRWSLDIDPIELP